MSYLTSRFEPIRCDFIGRHPRCPLVETAAQAFSGQALVKRGLSRGGAIRYTPRATAPPPPLRGAAPTPLPRCISKKIFQNFSLIIALLLALQAHSQAEKPKTVAQYYELGEIALQSKNYRTALAHYNECLRLQPLYWDAYYARAIARERLGDMQGALTDYNIFLEANPTNTEALFTRAVLRYQNSQWAAAREDFLKLLKNPAGETNTIFFQLDKGGQTNRIFTVQGNMLPTFLNYLGMVDIKLKKYKSSVHYLDSAIALLPTCADCYVNRGTAKQLSRDSVGALNDFNNALKIEPENSIAMHNVAVLSGFDGNLIETEKLLTNAIEKNPTLPYSYAERGHVRTKIQNWKGALADFNEAIRIDPNEADDWLSRGLVKEKLKDLSGALNDITQAIRLKSDFEKAWLCRGNVLVKLNRLTEAIEDYSLAIHHFPEYSSAYYNRALAYHKLGRLKEACSNLQTSQALGLKINIKVFSAVCK
jgi:tetratricopeptide (TPR) repeat protein